jgi:hypothetical protein
LTVTHFSVIIWRKQKIRANDALNEIVINPLYKMTSWATWRCSGFNCQLSVSLSLSLSKSLFQIAYCNSMSKEYFFIFYSGSPVSSGNVASRGVKFWTLFEGNIFYYKDYLIHFKPILSAKMSIWFQFLFVVTFS